METIHWESFPLPLIQVNPPSISRTNEIISTAYKIGNFSNSGEIQREASAVLSKHVNKEFDGYLACSNTSGLIACLLEIGVRNRHVLVSNFTFAATLNAVVLAGGIPVLCDVDPESLEISLEAATEILNNKNFDIAAVLPTRVFGFINDFSELIYSCEARGIPVVIDAAATFPDDVNVWKFKHQAKFEVFSLHATKVFGIGEGGLIVGGTQAIDSVKIRANFGIGTDGSFHFQDGLNGKADEFTAARALARFPEYARDTKIRRIFASKYKEIFENSSHIRLIDDGEETIYSYFPIIFDNESNLMKFIETVSPYIRTRRYYFPALSQGYAGESKIIKPVSLEYSESISSRTLCLPVYVDCSTEVEVELTKLLTFAERSLT